MPVNKPLRPTVWVFLRKLDLCAWPSTIRGRRGGNLRWRVIARGICGEVGNQTERSVHLDNSRPAATQSVRITRKASFCLLNVRSVNNEIEALDMVDVILDGDYNVVPLTETWIAPGDTVTCGTITLDGYTLHQALRASKRVGGVAILCKVGYKVTKSPSIEASSFESTSLYICCGTCAIRVVVICRPPSSTTTVFMNEFASLLHNLVLDPQNPLLVGDFNYQLNECTADAACLAGLL